MSQHCPATDPRLEEDAVDTPLWHRLMRREATSVHLPSPFQVHGKPRHKHAERLGELHLCLAWKLLCIAADSSLGTEPEGWFGLVACITTPLTNRSDAACHRTTSNGTLERTN